MLLKVSKFKYPKVTNITTISNIGLFKINLAHKFLYSTSPEAYCESLIKKQDYENYLISLFFPRQLRPGYNAIRAFNIEIASIKDLVSNINTGKMRLLFWRNAIDDIYKNQPSNQPVIQQLHRALEHSKLSLGFFKRIISERENNLEHSRFHTLEELEKYCENTASSLLYLQLELLDIKDVEIDHIASHIGKAIGISTFLRSFPYHVSKKNSIIPFEIMAKYKLSEEKLYREYSPDAAPSSELQDAIFEIATSAYNHIRKASSMIEKQNSSQIIIKAFPALLSMVPARSYLNNLEQAQFNPYDATLSRKNWKLPIQLLVHSYKKKL